MRSKKCFQTVVVFCVVFVFNNTAGKFRKEKEVNLIKKKQTKKLAFSEKPKFSEIEFISPSFRLMKNNISC